MISTKLPSSGLKHPHKIFDNRSITLRHILDLRWKIGAIIWTAEYFESRIFKSSQFRHKALLAVKAIKFGPQSFHQGVYCMRCKFSLYAITEKMDTKILESLIRFFILLSSVLFSLPYFLRSHASSFSFPPQPKRRNPKRG